MPNGALGVGTKCGSKFQEQKYRADSALHYFVTGFWVPQLAPKRDPRFHMSRRPWERAPQACGLPAPSKAWSSVLGHWQNMRRSCSLAGNTPCVPHTRRHARVPSCCVTHAHYRRAASRAMPHSQNVSGFLYLSWARTGHAHLSRILVVRQGVYVAHTNATSHVSAAYLFPIPLAVPSMRAHLSEGLRGLFKHRCVDACKRSTGLLAVKHRM